MPGIPGLSEAKMDRFEQEWRPQDALAAAGLGATTGGLYHGLKRNFYNTPEENAEEDAKGPMLLARRMALPAVGLAGLNAAQNSLAPNYYQQAALGNHQSITQPPISLSKTSADKNPYKDSGCPECGEHAVGSCRCLGPHATVQLAQGHGLKCPNGHHWSASNP